jgi:predicted PurR-regulated permease PerM
MDVPIQRPESIGVEGLPQAAVAAPVGGDPLQRSAWRWLRAAGVVVTLFVGWQLLLVVQSWVAGLLDVVLYIVFGTVLAFIGAPLARVFQRRLRFPRTIASLAALAVEIAVLATLGWVISGPLIAEGNSLARAIPDLIQRAQAHVGSLSSWLSTHGLPGIGGGTGSAAGSGKGGGAGGLASAAPAVLDRALTFMVSGVTATVGFLAGVVITVVTAFWLLRDGEELRGGLLALLPGRARAHVDFGLDATGVVIGGYVRGQLFMAALIGLMAWVGTLGLGVPYPVVVGVAAGVFELIPLVGPFVGGAVGVLLALTTGWLLAVWTVALFIGIHLLDGYVISPRIQARFIRVHPLVAFLALIAGIEVDGFWGALFAVPVTSLAAVFIRAALGDLRASRPQLFAPVPRGPGEERRTRILGEFHFSMPHEVRLFGRVVWPRSLGSRRG